MNREGLIRTFTHIPTVQTERLVLRKMSVWDAEDMYSYAKREDLTRYLLWSPHKNYDYTKEYLRYIQNRYAVGDFYDWAVIEKESGRMIGTCGFTRIDLENLVGEIGYVINPDFHKRGYAPEAASAVIRFGFEKLSLNRIEAKFMQCNEASRRVTEKLGMSFEGYMRSAMFVKGAYRTIGYASLLAEDYARQKKEKEAKN